MPSPKTNPHVLAALQDCLPGDFRIEHRQLFGCPCWFARGNMFAGVHGDDLFLRLAEDCRQELLCLEGAKPWKPGRGVMRQYACIPSTMIADEAVLKPWLRLAMEFALSLPPKRLSSRKTASHGQHSPYSVAHVVSPTAPQPTKQASKKVASSAAARKGRRITKRKRST